MKACNKHDVPQLPASEFEMSCRTLFNSNALGIIIADLSGSVQMVNNEFQRMLGY